MTSRATDFGLYGDASTPPRRWLGPTAVALACYAAAVAALLVLPQQLMPLPERRVDVRFVDRLDFVQEVPKPPPPAVAPPPPLVPAAPPAPVVQAPKPPPAEP